MNDETERRLGLGLGGGPGGGWVAPSVEALAEAIPGLRVLALAGRGGMGAVYRAEQTRLGRVVAVKLQPAGATGDPLARERFEREARVLAELRHPHVLQVHDFGALADGTPFLVTEWAEGGDLAARVAAGPARLEEVTDWVRQVASALDATHARGVVHRDLKPANVLVRGDGSLALADFGLARGEGAGFTTTLTISGVVFGTFDYMAPEQMGGPGGEGKITPATDVYALGVMTYQLLTGRMPRGMFTRASRVVRGVPAAVDGVIEAALANEPELRPRSAGEFARRLAAAGATTRRCRGLWLALVGMAAAGAILGLWVAAGKGLAGRSDGAEAGVEEPIRVPQAPRDATMAPASGGALEPKWTNVLAATRLDEHAVSGGWKRRGAEVASDDGVCKLRLPVAGVAESGYRYDVELEFTRVSGRNSVGVFLPTSSGLGVFELDAWNAGLGGVQMIDGQDMRAHGENFPAALRNGERQRVRIEVRGARVAVSWNGVPRRTWDLTGRRFEATWLWEISDWMGPGLCSWKSPTVFHRVAYQPITEGQTGN